MHTIFLYEKEDLTKGAVPKDLPLSVAPSVPSSASFPIATKPTVYSIESALTKAQNVDSKMSMALNKISSLAVDRWVGVEGVMAVVTYPKKSISLLYNSLTRKPKVGELDVFEEISNSIYHPSFKYSFASIPGSMAFFYYSGSLIFVFLGMAFFSTLVLLVDLTVFRVFKNHFLSAQIGFYFANALVQFGISPMPLFISFFMTICGLVALKGLNLVISKFK